MLSLNRRSNQPIVGTVSRLLSAIQAKVSEDTIEEAILSHPDYPSLLCVSDCLNSWKIENVWTRLEKSQIDDISLPFMAHFHNRLILISNVSENNVTGFDENGKDIIIEKEEFLLSWDGIVLLTETNSSLEEKSYSKKVRQQNNRLIPVLLLFLALTGLLLLAISALSTAGNWTMGYGVLIIAKLAGAIVTGLLLWYEIDKYNPALQKLCMGVGGKNTNCNAVLNSSHAKLFGWLSWGEIGFIYFSGSFLSLLFFPKSSNLISWFNITTLPFIMFSLFYQGFVIKHWCLFCLSVLGLLLLEFAGSSLGGLLWMQAFEGITPMMVSFLHSVLSFMLVASLWFLLKPILIQNNKSKNYKYELNRLKNTRGVFESLLSRENRVFGNEGLGITLGNLESSNTILKVCNPYCNPCAEAHKDISRILDENLDIKIQIIYNTSVSASDISREPVRHFLAVAENANSAEKKILLDNWYFNKSKDYRELSAKYPIHSDVLERQDEMIKSMFKWTRENNIMYTPTYFFNGRKLPRQYKLNNLSYLLSYPEVLGS